ncbi:hypothetical protein [Streptomyces antarcticus]|nr:hypothetical protein [Streptomyces sp. H34-AA3]MCY0945684.1 hypothetical protein [Streptomyces sp. H34-AA3]
MSSKYADLGRLGHCWRCGDSIQHYPDPAGQDMLLNMLKSVGL